MASKLASPMQPFQEVGDKLVKLYERIIILSDGFPTIVKDAAVDASWTKTLSSNCRNVIITIQDHERKRIFMGSTSFGKSTFVNAFLRNEVLPSGLGSTTSQVLKIRGTEKEEFIIKIGDASNKKQEKTFGDLDELISYISQWNEENEHLVHEVDITLPLNNFPMLNDNVVLIDSPGLGHEISYNNAVKATSGSVRSLILLVDIEGDFSIQDMEYMKVLCRGTTTAVPYIVMNKWDKAVEMYRSKPEKKETLHKKQMQRCVNFLTGQLGLSQQEAERKVFFLSGRRALEGEQWARDGFDDFFKAICTKEDEAMCMKNVPEHKKTVIAMLDIVTQMKQQAVQEFQEYTKEKSDDLKNSETINKIAQYKAKQLQVKLSDIINKSANRFEERVEHIEMNQEQATNLILTFIDEVGAEISQNVAAETQAFTAEVNDEIIRLLPPNSNEHFATSSKKFASAAREFEVDFATKARAASNWHHFKNVERVHKDIEERKENMGNIKEMFKVEKERAKALLVAERDTRLAIEIESIARREEKEINRAEMQRDAEIRHAEQESRDEIHKAERINQNAIIDEKEKKFTARTLHDKQVLAALHESQREQAKFHQQLQDDITAEMLRTEKLKAEKNAQLQQEASQARGDIQRTIEDKRTKELEKSMKTVTTEEEGLPGVVNFIPILGPLVSMIVGKNKRKHETISRDKVREINDKFNGDLTRELNNLQEDLNNKMDSRCQELNVQYEENSRKLKKKFRDEIVPEIEEKQHFAVNSANEELRRAEAASEQKRAEAERQCADAQMAAQKNLASVKNHTDCALTEKLASIRSKADREREIIEAKKREPIEDDFEELPENFMEEDFQTQIERAVKEECKDKLQTVCRVSNKIFDSVALEAERWMSQTVRDYREMAVDALNLALQENINPLSELEGKCKEIRSDIEALTEETKRLVGGSY